MLLLGFLATLYAPAAEARSMQLHTGTTSRIHGVVKPPEHPFGRVSSAPDPGQEEIARPRR
jgi:hypothetical protein